MANPVGADMRLDRFHLREDPFGATSDPRYFFRSDTHLRVLSSMISATRARTALQVLSSPPGLGKTSLLLTLFQELSAFHWAYRWTPMSDPSELYRSVMSDLHIKLDSNDPSAKRSAVLNVASTFEQRNASFVLVFDEAQNLGESVLNEVSDLIGRAPGLLVIFCGQPKLAELLRNQSTIAKHRRTDWILSPLSDDEVSGYIDHRLRIAGHIGQPLFNESAIALIARASAGVPRVINNVCWTVMSRDEAVDEYGEAHVLRALEVLKLGAPSDVVAEPAETVEASATTPVPPLTNRVDPVLLSSALQAWLRKKVRWSGTAGELLSGLSAAEGRFAPLADRPSAVDVLETLRNQSGALLSRGIVVDFFSRTGLPQMITLQLSAAPKPPLAVIPNEPVIPKATEQVSLAKQREPKIESTAPERRQPNSWATPRRRRWRAIHVWVFVTLLAAGGSTFRLYKRSQSSFVRAAETQPINDLGDQLRQERQSQPNEPAAQKALGLRYLRGEGVPADRATALQWLRKAAANRDPESQYLFGLNLEPDNKPEAYKWLVISYVAGFEKSSSEVQRLTHELTPSEIGKVRYDLGLAYATGEGTNIDYVRAYMWMTLAAVAGISESKPKLAELSQKMSRQDIDKASRQSSAWLARMRAPQSLNGTAAQD